MLFTHKTFLSWLLYFVVAMFAYAGLILFGVPQLVLAYDHTHLALALFGLYAVAEGCVAYQAAAISREQRSLLDLSRALTTSKLDKIFVMSDGSTHAVIKSRKGSKIPPTTPLTGAFGEHVRALYQRAGNGDATSDHRLLNDVMAERIARRADTGAFFASRIVWVGILATVLGVVLAFWPFLSAGGDIEGLKGNLGGFFSGVAVAFIPTTISFVMKIALDFSQAILAHGAAETIEMATVISEVHVVPVLAEQAAEAKSRVRSPLDDLGVRG